MLHSMTADRSTMVAPSTTTPTIHSGESNELKENAHLQLRKVGILFSCVRDSRLLIVAFDQLGGNSGDVAEEAAGSFVFQGSEVELCSRCFCGIAVGGADISRADSPDAVDGERVAARILQESVELSGGEVIGCNEAAGLRSAAAGKLRDQQIVAEAAEIKRSQRNAPWSIQPVAVFETPQELSRGAVDIHIAQARPIGFELRAVLVQDVGHDNVVADGLRIERHEITWQALVDKWFIAIPPMVFVEREVIMRISAWLNARQRHRMKGVVVDVDTSLGEVGSVEIAAAIDKRAGEPGVAGSVGAPGYSHGEGGSDTRIPGGDRSVERGEQKRGRRFWREEKVSGAAVGDRACRSAGWRLFVVGIGWG